MSYKNNIKGFNIIDDIKSVRLSDEEEIEAVKNKDYDKLIPNFKNLIIFFINKYSNCPDYNQDDFFQISLIALKKAVDNFDDNKNIKFTSFFSRICFNEINMYLRHSRRHLRGVSLDEIISEDLTGHVMMLSDIITDEKNSYILDDLLIVEAKLFANEVFESMKDGLRKEIIRKSFFSKYDKIKQYEIADEFSVHRTYVSRIQSDFLRKLKYEYKIKFKGE